MNYKRINQLSCFVAGLIVLALASETYAKPDGPLPFSDPQNTGKWILNTAVSDEFDGTDIDEERWYIVGQFEDGKSFYTHPDKHRK